jgi:hypothetical protein
LKQIAALLGVGLVPAREPTQGRSATSWQHPRIGPA